MTLFYLGDTSKNGFGLVYTLQPILVTLPDWLHYYCNILSMGYIDSVRLNFRASVSQKCVH